MNDVGVTNDEVFRAIRDMVATGDYCDLRYERAEGPELEQPTRRPDGTIDQQEIMRWWNHRPERVQVIRGTKAYLAAFDRGLLEALPALEPAPVEAVDDAEQAMGLQLPSLLRRLYLEVANGGFGPDDGIMGVYGGAIGEVGNLVETNLSLLDDPGYRDEVPDGLMWFHDWGCAIASLIDCNTPDGRIWHWDPNVENNEQTLKPRTMSLSDWFTHWIDRRLEVGLPL